MLSGIGKGLNDGFRTDSYLCWLMLAGRSGHQVNYYYPRKGPTERSLEPSAFIIKLNRHLNRYSRCLSPFGSIKEL
jgi:hypothetical protein